MGANDRMRSAYGGPPSKVLGNGLRELDRFLSVLIDEVATATEIDDEALAVLRTRRNTANKLRTLHAALDRDSPDLPRLRALGRSRDCFFYCGGLVRRADSRTGSSMTTGWVDRSSTTKATITTVALGSRMRTDIVDIDDICRFYDRIGNELLAVSEALPVRKPRAPRNSVAFLRDYAHMSLAIVACDGL